MATRGRRYKARKAEKWAFWPSWGDFEAIGAQNRWSRTPRSMIRFARECRGPHRRLLPTAGVCEQREGVHIRLLPTAGVCDQHVDVNVIIRILPTAGDKHV